MTARGKAAQAVRAMLSATAPLQNLRTILLFLRRCAAFEREAGGPQRIDGRRARAPEEVRRVRLRELLSLLPRIREKLRIRENCLPPSRGLSLSTLVRCTSLARERRANPV